MTELETVNDAMNGAVAAVLLETVDPAVHIRDGGEGYEDAFRRHENRRRDCAKVQTIPKANIWWKQPEGPAWGYAYAIADLLDKHFRPVAAGRP